MLDKVRSIAREIRWISRGVVGANAYDNYVLFHQGSGCTHPPLSEKEFWREKYKAEDANPGARCC